MKVYVDNYGCACNHALGNRLKESIVEGGLGLARSPEDAHAVVVNTCTVKGRTERRMLRRILELKESHGGSNVIVAGCMPTVQRELVASVSPLSPLFGTYQYDRVPEALGAGPGNVGTSRRHPHRPISRFEPRPGTQASRLSQLPGGEIKRRSRIMTRVAREVSLKGNEGWTGWKGDAFVSEEAPRGGLVLRNGYYKPIIAGGPLEIGSEVGVIVRDAHPYCLIGEVEQ